MRCLWRNLLRGIVLIAVGGIGTSCYAQSYQYSDWFPMYVQQRRPLPAQLYFLDWDAACAEARDPGMLTTYTNPRGAFHPEFGAGCFYNVNLPWLKDPNWFGQGWAIPRKACPSKIGRAHV